MKNKKYIKSPLNYTGGKYKLLEQILPLFPDRVDTFVDLFGGGFNVGINVEAEKVVYNDIVRPLVDLLYYFKQSQYTEVIRDIEGIIDEYDLTDTYRNGYKHYNCNSSSGVAKINKDSYLKLRNDYNTGNKSSVMFYTMIIFAFNNMIRFNSKNEFNVAVNKRDFNKSLRNNLKIFIDKLHNTDIHFINKDFRVIDYSKLKSNDFIYCDPPYLITLANYNENGGWTDIEELELLEILDDLNNKNIKFALSNVLESKGKSNDILKDWSKKYNINHIKSTYKNCNYQKKNCEEKDLEVLITNY